MGERNLALGLVVGALAFASGGGAIAAAAPGFLPAETLAGTGTVASTVQTAMAPNGFAIAGWEETLPSGQSAVRVATRPPGGPWSSAQQIELGTTPKAPQFPVSVAIDAAGDAAIAWTDQPSMTSNNALVSTRTAGQSFGTPQPLTGAADPVVGVDASGNVTMIVVEPGATTEVARTWPAGTVMPPVPATNLGNGCGGIFPGSLAVAPGGDAIAGIDCGTANTGGTTFVRRIAGVWQPAVILGHNSISGGTQTSGNAVAVAIDGKGTPAGLFIEEVSSGAPPVTTSNYSLDLVTPTTTGMQLVMPPVDTATATGFFGGSEINFPGIAAGGGSELLGWAVTGVGASGDTRAQVYNGSTPAGSPQTLGPSVGGPSVALSAGGPRLAVFEKASGTELDAAVAQPGGSFSVTPISSANTLASVALDDAGDGVVAFAPPGTGATGAQARGFDATPPTIQSASIPSSALAGRPAAFSAAASDFWGPVTLSWNFGDGTVGGGGSVTHTYTSRGARTVTVTATDAVGNAAARSAAINVTAIPPVLSGVSESRASFRVGRTSTPLIARARHRRAPVGTTFAFRLDQPSQVSLAISRKTAGRRSGRRCVKPTKKLRGHRSCVLLVPVATLRRTGVAGLNRVAFSGRIRGHALAPGSYQVTFTAAAFGVAGKPRALKFQIVR
jgi:PKD domain